MNNYDDLMAEIREMNLDETEDTTETVESDESVLSVKHRGEEVKLSKQDAEEAAQLGLFIKDNNALDSLKWMIEQAKEEGYANVAEYQKHLAEEARERKIATLVEEEGITEEEAAKKVDSKSDTLVEEIVAFNKEFPGIDVQKLPDEVLKERQNGNTLTEAYYRYYYRTKSEADRVAAEQDKNKEQFPGSLTSTGSPESTSFFDEIAAKMDKI